MSIFDIFSKTHPLDERKGFRRDISEIIYTCLADSIIQLSRNSSIFLLLLYDLVSIKLDEKDMHKFIENRPDKLPYYRDKDSLVEAMNYENSDRIQSMIDESDIIFQSLWVSVIEYYLKRVPALFYFNGYVARNNDNKNVGINYYDIYEVMILTLALLNKSYPHTKSLINQEFINRLVLNSQYVKKIDINNEKAVLETKERMKECDGLDLSIPYFYQEYYNKPNANYIYSSILNSEGCKGIFWGYLETFFNDTILHWYMMGCFEGSKKANLYKQVQTNFWNRVKSDLKELGYEI